MARPTEKGEVGRTGSAHQPDGVAGPTTATLLMTRAGSYSCSITGAKSSCLLVAKAGAPLPAPFDVAPANLFSADLHTLAADTAAYDVRAAPARPASGAVPASQCFDVSSVATASPSPTGSPSPGARIPSGRYCFTAAGVLAAASYPSGN